MQVVVFLVSNSKLWDDDLCLSNWQNKLNRAVQIMQKHVGCLGLGTHEEKATMQVRNYFIQIICLDMKTVTSEKALEFAIINLKSCCGMFVQNIVHDY